MSMDVTLLSKTVDQLLFVTTLFRDKQEINCLEATNFRDKDLDYLIL